MTTRLSNLFCDLEAFYLLTFSGFVAEWKFRILGL